MESQMTPAQPEQKKSGLMFLEIGIFEIAFVVIGIAILLGALNYFNIINLSSISPSLSFLPKQQSLSSNKSTNDTSIQPKYDPKKERELKTKIDGLIYQKYKAASNSSSTEPTPSVSE